MNPANPIFFLPNRVGKNTGEGLLDRFLATQGYEGKQYGQEWIASTKSAGLPTDSEVGLSRIEGLEEGKPGPLLLEVAESIGESIFGPEHFEEYGPGTGLDCRLIDCSGERFMTCHHTAPTCICVLGVMEKDGRNPTMLVGNPIEGDNRKIVSLEVQAGRTFYIPPGTPYQLGRGMFVLQVSSMNRDFEHIAVPDEIPTLTSDDANGVFKSLRPNEILATHNDMGVITELVSTEHVGFKFQRAEITGRMDLTQEKSFSIILCAAGTGTMSWAGGTREIRSGEYFLQPYTLPWVTFAAEKRFCLIKVQSVPKT